MKNIFRKINHFLFHLALWPILILSPIAFLGEITSPRFIIRFFTAIGLPNGYAHIVTIGLSLCVVLLITVILKAKVFQEKHFV